MDSSSDSTIAGSNANILPLQMTRHQQCISLEDQKLFVKTESGTIRPWGPSTDLAIDNIEIMEAPFIILDETDSKVLQPLNVQTIDVIEVIDMPFIFPDETIQKVEQTVDSGSEEEYEEVLTKEQVEQTVDSDSDEDDEEYEEVLTKEQIIKSLEDSDESEPENSDEYSWSDDFSTFVGKREPFLGKVGPKFADTSPSDIFCQLWDQTLLETIVEESNRYAWQTIAQASESKTGIPSHSRVNDWVETSVSEMYRLISVIILMGICLRSRVDEYWSTGIMRMSEFRSIMTRDRFILLMKFLHFTDNDYIIDRGYDRKMAKIKPLLDYLNEKFQAVYSPHRELSIDESLLLWKGRLSWVQCIRTKAARFGIKSYDLCEAVSGYVLKSHIYTGKESNSLDPVCGFSSHSAKIVLKLINEYLGKGHTLFMDNFYNSIQLCKYLKKHGTDVVGTLNRRRPNTPADIKSLNEKTITRGKVVSRHCGDISVTAWKDVKLVTTVSTYHNAELVVGKRAGEIILKPEVIPDYNKYMGGVDRKDQKLAMYLLERKRGSKWYMKVFKRLLNISILNSYIIYCSNMGSKNKITHRQFRYELAMELVAKHGTSSVMRNRSFSAKDNCTRLDKSKDHFPEHVEIEGERISAKQNRFKRSTCVRCLAKKIRTTTNIFCRQCKVFLCVGQCWREFHTLEEH